MNLPPDSLSTSVGMSVRHSSLGLAVAVLARLFVMLPGIAFPAVADEPRVPVLEFIAPTNHAVFSTRDEIPLVLRAFASNDVFVSADVFADHQPVATAVYCCPFCPCPPPTEGQETTLQIPVPWEGGMPPPRVWQGWTNVPAGAHRLTARATGENGAVVAAAPVTITVLDLTLQLFVSADGAVTLVIPQGSLVEGGYDLEESPDLQTWARVGPFAPGNVAAFYFDLPPVTAHERRFYRSVRVPPGGR